MKLNDYDEGTGGRFASGAAALAVLLIVSVIIIVLVANKDYLKRKFGSDSSSVTTSVSETSAQASSSTGASNSEVLPQPKSKTDKSNDIVIAAISFIFIILSSLIAIQ